MAMINTMKQGVAALRAVAGTATEPAPAAVVMPTKVIEASVETVQGKSATRIDSASGIKDTVLIGSHFPRAVRRTLSTLQAMQLNDGKKVHDLLAEALDDLFVKYGQPRVAVNNLRE